LWSPGFARRHSYKDDHYVRRQQGDHKGRPYIIVPYGTR
jgi:hypothetical protein